MNCGVILCIGLFNSTGFREIRRNCRLLDVRRRVTIRCQTKNDYRRIQSLSVIIINLAVIKFHAQFCLK